MSTEDNDWVEKIGKPAYESIAEMVSALECDYERLEELREEENPEHAEELAELEEDAGECSDQDDALQRILDDALDVTIRGERRDGQWTADEFQILLTTGGPAVRIVGELDHNGEPTRAWLEVQDWGKSWTRYFPADQDTLLAYCRCFGLGD